MMNSLKIDYLKLINRIKKECNNVTISLDTNDDPENIWGDEILKILHEIDFLLLNKKEALKISKESEMQKAINKLNKMVKTVIIKSGIDGYLAKSNDNYYREAAMPAVLRDSTGAGDNFDAGFIFGVLNNLDIEKSLKIANICGSKSIEYRGGNWK